MIAPHGGLAWKAVGGRLTLVLAVIVALSVLAISQIAVRAFDAAVEPELASRARLIGVMVRETVQRPLERGIPFEALAGLDRYLAEVLARFEEVDRIAIATADGRPVAVAEREPTPGLLRRALPDRLQARGPSYSLPILDGARLAGTIVVQVRADFLHTRLRDVFLDIMVIALVATLIAL